jgi:hypothetical protein
MADIEIAADIDAVSDVSPDLNLEHSISSNIDSVSDVSPDLNQEHSISSDIDGVSEVESTLNVEYSIDVQILALSEIEALVSKDIGIGIDIDSSSSVALAFARDDYGTENAVPCEQVDYERPQEAAGKCTKSCITNYKYVYGDDWEYQCQGETKSFFFQAGSNISYADAQSNYLAGALALQEQLQEDGCYAFIDVTSTKTSGEFFIRILTGDGEDYEVVWWDGTVETYASGDTASRIVSGDPEITIRLRSFSPMTQLQSNSMEISQVVLDQNPFFERIILVNNELSSIGLTSQPNLDTLDLETNNLTAIDLSGNPLLTFVSLSDNDITVLNTLSNPLIEFLFVGENLLTSLSVNHLPNLENLSMGGNVGITSINLSQNLDLLQFTTSGCSITSFDFSANVLLFLVDVSQNPIGSIDVSMLPNLENFRLQICGVSVLDISNNPLIILLAADANSLPEAQVDDVLIKLDAAGLSNGEVILTNNAPPGAPGLAAKASLQGKGWNVDTD